MPQLRLSTHGNYLTQVVQAFEAEVGLPKSQQADAAWLRTVVAEYNKAHHTDIAYSHEDYGYWFSYSTPTEAQLLGAIRETYRLGGQ